MMKPLKSTYLYPSVLLVGLYQTHWNEIAELVSITLVSITSFELDLRQTNLLKSYKGNKEISKLH